MHVETIMTREVVTVGSETPLKEVAALLAARRISGVPVCDRENHVVGVVSEADILVKEEGFPPGPRRPMAWLFGESGADLRKSGARTAGEAMTAPAITVEPSRPLSQAARIMVDRGINRLPVVLHGELLGIVTRADLVRAFARTDDELRQEIARDALLGRLWTHPEQARVTVEGGVAVAEGEVERHTQAELVAACLRSLPGIVEVDVSLVSWREDDLVRR
jgi:CBS domain-containing protein